MAPAWQEKMQRAAQKSLAVMCPACSRSPDGVREPRPHHSSGIDVPMKRQVSLGCVGSTDCAITRQLAAPGRLAATTFGAPSTAIQRKLPQDRASASDSSKYIRAYQSLLFTANRHDHAYRCRRSDRVLLVLHGHLHIGPPPILAQKHAPSCGWRGGSGLVTTHRAGLTN